MSCTDSGANATADVTADSFDEPDLIWIIVLCVEDDPEEADDEFADDDVTVRV